MDQEVLAGRQPGAFGKEDPSGDDVMPVGMVAQIAGPGLEDPYHSDPAADEPWIQYGER